jgi:hypothetical protein
MKTVPQSAIQADCAKFSIDEIIMKKSGGIAK